MNHRLSNYTFYILLIGLLGFLPAVNAAPGDLDPTFSHDGKTTDGVGAGNMDSGQAMALQPDGKIVVAGSAQYGTFEVCAVARYNPDGSFDPGFDEDGKTYVLLNNHFVCTSAAIQTDGKIVASGLTINNISYEFAVVRFNADGSLDPTFDGDGKAATPVGSGSSLAFGLAIQADGKIVMAGYSNSPNFDSDFALVRFNPNGSLDPTFDGDGKVTTQVMSEDDVANSVAIQTDGKIVAVGYSRSATDADFAAVRYNADGSLDSTFDGDGKVTTPFVSFTSDVANSVAIQPDGKIVAAGSANNFLDNDFAVVRYNPDGSLDSTFDGDGKAQTPVLNSSDIAENITIQTDGRIIVGGSSRIDNVDYDFAFVRYNPDGSLDSSFDGDGTAINNLGFFVSSARATAIQRDGKIVVAGYSYDGSQYDIILVRYNPNGILDPTFDGDGRVTISFGSSANDFANAVAIQTDGKIVAAGYSESNGLSDFAVVRCNADGSPDTSFDGDGKVLTPVWVGNDAANAVAIQTNGKIVVAGYANNGMNDDYAVLRYNSDGSLDAGFDGDGKAVTTILANDYANAVAVQTDGKIVAAGYSYNGFGDFSLVRYNGDGALDPTFSGDGKVTMEFGFSTVEAAYAIAIQTDGKIVAAGSAATDFGLMRFNANGALDQTFGIEGKVTTNLGSFNESINAVALQRDGRIVAAGYLKNGLHNDFALVRYNPNGSLDNQRYGTDGKVIFDIFGASNDIINGMALDSNGNSVVAGTSNGVFALARVINAPLFAPAPFDFDGDKKSDISIFRPGAGEWWLNRSSTGATSAVSFGISSDKITPADFTGDGLTDVAIWRPASGEWFILRSEDNSYYSVPFGTAGDVPVPADYDGDGAADVAVYRPATFTWFINQSSGGTTITYFGAAGDVPVTGDYDGDAKSDLAIFRASTGEWWINRSSDGSTIVAQLGNSTDKPVPGDYTGDGRTDIAVWRPTSGEWFILRSEDGSFYSVPFGVSGDIPAPGDYDGDGRFDTAVFRPSGATWYINRSSAGLLITNFGAGGDLPVPNAFVP